MSNPELRAQIEEYVVQHPSKVYRAQARELENNGYTLLFPSKDEDIFADARIVEDAILSPSWCIGGMTGGNCYDDTVADQAVEPDEKPTWLEELVCRLSPSTSILSFFELNKKCVRLEYTVNEEYGNHFIMAFEVLRVSDLLEVLDA